MAVLTQAQAKVVAKRGWDVAVGVEALVFLLTSW